jgi:UDP-N-acetylmuramoylalanine--D-glutamate ligase
VVSPGVPREADPVQWAGACGIPVVGELELGSWYCSGRIVAVTGSNGKSTVVTLLGEIAARAGKDVVVCGNIGAPLTGFLDKIKPATIVVLEVSSFQLEESLSFQPSIGCVLNVTDNHFDRHGSLDKYKAAKGRLFAFQRKGDWALLNADDAGSRSYAARITGTLAFYSRKKKTLGAYLYDESLLLNLPGLSGEICKRQEMSLQGPHHEENGLAAACLAGMLGIPPSVSGSVLKSFRGLPHRQQVVGSRGGVTFVNDSKSTTVAAGLKAIESAQGKVVLIAGGIDKGSDFRLIRRLKEKLKGAVLIGRDGPKIAAALKGVVTCLMAADLKDAVVTAAGMAQEGNCVLLSPMCTSFDMFRDFEDRGEQFEQIVHAMLHGQAPESAGEVR